MTTKEDLRLVLNVVVLDDEFWTKFSLVRNDIAKNFACGDYGSIETFNGIGGIAFTAINEFMKEMGLME